jgi:hypothetical protein
MQHTHHIRANIFLCFERNQRAKQFLLGVAAKMFRYLSNNLLHKEM